MERSDATGIGLAVAGHVLLFGALSLGWMSRSTPLVLNDPVEVQLVDNVGLHSAQPQVATQEPAPSVAPEMAPPEPTPPPAPAKAQAKPAEEKPALTPAAKPKPTHLKQDLALASVASAAATPKGRILGAHFLDGISDKPSASTSKTPKAATLSTQAMAGLADAIYKQVKPCADRIINPGPGASDIHNKIQLLMNKDGSLAVLPNMLSQTGVDDDNRRYAQRVKELAIGAFAQCAPFHLPSELYRTANGQGWNNIAINYHLP